MTGPAAHDGADPFLREDGSLFAPRYEDFYFQADGLAESRHVFVDGNDLDVRFAHARQFTVAETGFGTGLNFLATWERFRRVAPAGARLCFVSIEAHPLSAATMRQALVRFPELAAQVDTLIAALPAAWPAEQRDLVRLSFDDGRVGLCLLVGDVGEMLTRYRFAADAWFLDGFAPSRNAAMWSEPVLRRVAEHTRDGGTFATYTVANAVRSGLGAAGFALDRRPGHGRKREMLVGTLPGAWHPRTPPPDRVAVVGAGLAGCSAAHAFAARGVAVDVFDPAGIAGGASGHGLAVLQPRIGDDPDARFVALGFRFTRAWFDRFGGAGLFVPCGVLQPALEGAEAERLVRRLARGAHPLDEARWIDADECARRAGASVGPHGGVWLERAGVVRSAAFCRRLLDDPRITLRLRDGADAAEPRVLAHALGARATLPDLVMGAARGQVTILDASAGSPPHCVVSRGGYLTPAIGGLRAAGATFARDDEDLAERDADDATNRAHFADWFGDALGSTRRAAHVGLRALTTDRFPYVGAIGEGAVGSGRTWVSLAHGARGLATAPLAGEIIAALACGEPAPVDGDLLDRITPARRSARRAFTSS